jgi:hypothetical protein
MPVTSSSSLRSRRAARSTLLNATGERGDQVELDAVILVLQQRAELGPRVVAAEQREIEILGVEKHGLRQPR